MLIFNALNKAASAFSRSLFQKYACPKQEYTTLSVLDIAPFIRMAL
jgi:hypothetical protein